MSKNRISFVQNTT